MSLAKFIRFISHSALSGIQTLLPAMCIMCGCKAQAHNLCAGCQQDLPILSQHCQQCARFLLADIPQNLVCGECLKNPPPYDCTFALFPYQPPVTQLIIKLKFQQQLSHAKTLGELLAKKIQQDWYVEKTLPDLIMPIPLHKKRLQQRGFNQAIEIARPISKILKIPLNNTVKRSKNTLPQSGLPAKERKRNMARAFTSTHDFSGLTIAVLDDVITTGHTITEFCKTIKQSGAKSIHVWCCARRG